LTAQWWTPLQTTKEKLSLFLDPSGWDPSGWDIIGDSSTNNRHPHEQIIPAIGEAKFVEYYGLKYNGQLSSVISKWDSPDDEDVVSCGTNPDFFDFFKLPQSQRQVRIYIGCAYISINIDSLFNRC
jgi:hypothetical protein